MKRNPGLPLPPRLSMDAYADFVAANWQRGNVEQMRRQKEVEKRIDKPFCILSASLSERECCAWSMLGRGTCDS